MCHLLSEVTRGTPDQILSWIYTTKEVGASICMGKSGRDVYRSLLHLGYFQTGNTSDV